jgi:hypothetical protein
MSAADEVEHEYVKMECITTADAMIAFSAI